MNIKSCTNLFFRHFRAILMGAAGFGLTHGVQVLIVGYIRNNSFSTRLSAIVALFFYEIIEAFIFIPAGLILAYFPSYILETIINRSPVSKRLLISIVVGMIFGLSFLPLCALVAFSTFPSPDSPSYLERCKEYALPMIIAGMFGGYGFWRIGGGNSDPQLQALR